MTNGNYNELRGLLDEVDDILVRTGVLTQGRGLDLVEKLRARGKEQARLASRACEMRDRMGQNFLTVRASIEFSNHCRQKCSFCGMNKLNKQLERYRMTYEHLARVIDDVAELGITDLHLASGEDWVYETDDLDRVIKHAVAAGLEVTLVTGQRKLDDYQSWRASGATRYILKVETTNNTLFQAARTGTQLRERIAHLLFLRSLGYKIGTGIICGLPGQSLEDLARDVCFLSCFAPDMASVSRFLPNEQSLLAGEMEGDPDVTVNFISLIRLEVKRPELRIPAGTTLGRRQVDAILHGANVVSLHVTPSEYADLYSADRIKERHLTQMSALKQLSEETGLGLRFKVT